MILYKPHLFLLFPSSIITCDKSDSIIYVLLFSLNYLNNAGSAMGGDTITTGKRVNNTSNDSVFNNVFVSISTKNISLCLSTTSHAKSLWLHLWHCLVGDCPQHDRIFRGITCKCLYI